MFLDVDMLMLHCCGDAALQTHRHRECDSRSKLGCLYNNTRQQRRLGAVDVEGDFSGAGSGGAECVDSGGSGSGGSSSSGSSSNSSGSSGSGGSRGGLRQQTAGTGSSGSYQHLQQSRLTALADANITPFACFLKPTVSAPMLSGSVVSRLPIRSSSVTAPHPDSRPSSRCVNAFPFRARCFRLGRFPSVGGRLDRLFPDRFRSARAVRRLIEEGRTVRQLPGLGF